MGIPFSVSGIDAASTVTLTRTKCLLKMNERVSKAKQFHDLLCTDGGVGRKQYDLNTDSQPFEFKESQSLSRNQPQQVISSHNTIHVLANHMPTHQRNLTEY